MSQGDDLPLVFHLITGLGVGGAERMLARTSARTQTYRHEVCVLSHKGPVAAELEAAGIPVKALGMSANPSAATQLLKLRAEIRSASPAIVQSWLVHSNIAAALLAPEGLPLIWNVRHTLDGFDRERRLTRWAVRGSAILSRRATAIVYNSTRARNHHTAIGYPSSRAFVIPNGFELPEANMRRREAFRRSIGLSPDQLAVGLVARAHAIKNHEGFLTAGERILRDEPRVRLVLAGKGTGKAEALAQMWDQRLSGRAIWLGERDDVDDINAALDLATNVSFGEAFSNTLGEAMAAGVPCIATNVGESAELLGDTGWICRSPSPLDIEAALRVAIATSPAELRRRGVAARVRICENYSLDAATRKFEDIYDRVRVRSSA